MSVNVTSNVPGILEVITGFNTFAFGKKWIFVSAVDQTPPLAAIVPFTLNVKLHAEVSGKISGNKNKVTTELTELLHTLSV
ncbi:hypothetical protein D3C76_1811030 [compost metagenome]